MKTFLLFALSLPAVFSFSFEDLASTVLDFVPYIGNIKSLKEAYEGEDSITRKKLTKFERSMSFLGGFPGINYLKNVKYLKNYLKFWKASERMKKAGKIKNAIKFLKASIRQLSKAYKVPNMIRNSFKTIKGLFKCLRN